jgi:hypothetical protein
VWLRLDWCCLEAGPVQRWWVDAFSRGMHGLKVILKSAAHFSVIILGVFVYTAMSEGGPY